jgi:hypothetical protein
MIEDPEGVDGDEVAQPLGEKSRNETIGDVDGSEQDVKAPSPPTQEASAPSADKGSFDSFQQ